MDLSTRYLGLELPHPIMPGASPLAHEPDSVRRLEDAGAAAIVMHSLFEEQLIGEQLDAHDAQEMHAHSFSEATSYLPSPEGFVLGPDEYLELLATIKNSVGIPVIGSLNGNSPGGWTEHAALIEEAGADALELNIYSVATDPASDAQKLEDQTVELCRMVKDRIGIPVAAKLSPFYTSLPNLTRKLDAVGVDGVVLFNRFYQPDIDIDNLDVTYKLDLSHSSELLLRLRWLAILSGRCDASLAVTGGIHDAVDAVKAVMCGAHAVQMVSALLLHGPEYLAKVRRELEAWLEENEYDSLAQMQGSMGLDRCPDPRAFERGNYIRTLQSWWR
jgi:dihydroorotate dehydrogenase (fumarate)